MAPKMSAASIETHRRCAKRARREGHCANVAALFYKTARDVGNRRKRRNMSARAAFARASSRQLTASRKYVPEADGKLKNVLEEANAAFGVHLVPMRIISIAAAQNGDSGGEHQLRFGIK